MEHLDMAASYNNQGVALLLKGNATGASGKLMGALAHLKSAISTFSTELDHSQRSTKIEGFGYCNLALESAPIYETSPSSPAFLVPPVSRKDQCRQVVDTDLCSAIIIFNLGLSFQCMKSNNADHLSHLAKAAQLYCMSLRALENLQGHTKISLLLRLSTIRNLMYVRSMTNSVIKTSFEVSIPSLLPSSGFDATVLAEPEIQEIYVSVLVLLGSHQAAPAA